ncbi:hypothetical protein SKAU_G00296250 [Synaphobranchus kaupii]|uniref:MIF4G domain-containing protein n=1 Tax=Synaphobranchus kaupii TaxID=118154 RepID=A0A9Q1ILV1_SYNKA|nr:hypothetical protein SKAU_G00296250 [Synaphobranchus kaupii]
MGSIVPLPFLNPRCLLRWASNKIGASKSAVITSPATYLPESCIPEKSFYSSNIRSPHHRISRMKFGGEPSEMGIQQDRRIQVCRNNITGDLPARILYSREELLQLQYSVTPPPDIPDEIRRREQGDRNGTWRTISHVPFKARNTWKPSMRKDRVEHHPQTATVQSTETGKIIGGVSFSNDVRLHVVQNAWKPSNRKAKVEQDPEKTATQEVFGQMRSILNKLTPERFEKLMKQVSELSINTEDHLEGIGNMVFEKAIGEVKFTSTYANMCHYLKELTVPCRDPSFQLNFRFLMLHLCRKEFFRVNGDGKILEKELQDLNAANTEEESLHLKEELGAKVIAHRRRAVGTMKFLGELFKLNMVRDVVILGCVSTYLDTQSEEALECLCCLITTTGTALDCENVKPQMDGYFSQLNQILKEGKSTSRVRFMLQDVMDLRQNNWVPRRYEQGPKIISQVHEEAELEILLGKMQLLSISTELAQAEQVKSTISTELAQAEQVQCSTISTPMVHEEAELEILLGKMQLLSISTELAQAEQVKSTISTELAQAEQVQCSTISTPMVHEEAELEILLGKMQLLSISTELAQAEQVQSTIATERAQAEQVQSTISTELAVAEQVQSTITELAQTEQVQTTISTKLALAEQVQSTITELAQAEQVQSTIATELAQAEQVKSTITELAQAEQVQSTISTELAQAEQVQTTISTELAQAVRDQRTISTPMVQGTETLKIISNVSFSHDVKLHVVQNAWRPSFRQAKVDQDPEMTVTQELFRRMRSILNKVTPEMFEQLVKQVAELQMDTTERLQGVVDIIFEKAICEPKFASTYARMCHCLKELHAPINDCPEVTLHFQQAILHRCWMQFNERAEEEANVTAQRRRSIGNMTFLGELFKLEMAEEYFMHRCITTLLDSQEEALLECLCCLLSTIGSKLDCDKAKCHMDKYTRQMEQIPKAGKTSSRISFMVKDIMDLRQNNWVPRNSDQGPKTIRQVHKQAELERSKVEQQLQSKGNWDHRHWNQSAFFAPRTIRYVNTLLQPSPTPRYA